MDSLSCIPTDNLKLALEAIVDGGGPYSRQRRVSEAIRHYYTKAQHWSRRQGVCGFGIGLKKVSGEITADIGITVFVRRKRARQKLDYPVPTRLFVPSADREIFVDVQELNPLRFQQGNSIVGGGSRIRHIRDTNSFGTLGCLVRDATEPQKTYILSNSHVLALKGFAASGEAIHSVEANGSTGPLIGKLTRFIPYLPGPGFPNLVDVAIAEVVSPDVIPNIGSLGPTGVSHLCFPGMGVHIQGGASEQKNSIVETINACIEVDLGDQGKFGFRDQIVCRDYTNFGDSGSCVLNDRGRAVGLHFWGTDGTNDGIDGNVSVFSPMKNALVAFEPAFKLEIVTIDGTRDLSGFRPAAASAPPIMPTTPDLGSRPPVNHPEDAIDVMARTLWGEARGEGTDGLKAVSEVVYNRAIHQSRRYGPTVEAVCRKPFAFSCWNDGDPNRNKLLAVNGSDAHFQTCLQIAKQVTNGEVTNLTKGARHYFDKRIPTPIWARDHTPCAEIKNHIFFNDIV